MIQTIIPCNEAETKIQEWCDHCKKKKDEVRKMYFIESTNPKMKTKVLCNCCMDLALSETNILPEDF